jgi:hypothetical protein
MNMATIGVLLRKADLAAVESMSLPVESGRLFERGKRSRSAIVSAPVFCTPAAITNNDPTASTALFERPAKASSGVKMPSKTSNPRHPTRAMSGRKISLMSTIIKAMMIERVAQACQESSSRIVTDVVERRFMHSRASLHPIERRPSSRRRWE